MANEHDWLTEEAKKVYLSLTPESQKKADAYLEKLIRKEQEGTSKKLPQKWYQRINLELIENTCWVTVVLNAIYGIAFLHGVLTQMRNLSWVWTWVPAILLIVVAYQFAQRHLTGGSNGCAGQSGKEPPAPSSLR